MNRPLAPQARTNRCHRALKKPAAAGTPRLWRRLPGLGMLALPSASLAASVPPPAAGGGLVQVIFGLIAVLALLLVSAWLLKRYGGRLPGAGGGGALRVLGGVSLGARERAVLLQVGDKQLLVGVAPGRVQTLYVLDSPAIPTGLAGHSGPAAAAATEGFAERLAALLRGGRAP